MTTPLHPRRRRGRPFECRCCLARVLVPSSTPVRQSDGYAAHADKTQNPKENQ